MPHDDVMLQECFSIALMVECRPRNISTSGSERRHVFHGIWAVQRHACTATPLHNGDRWSILDTVNVIIRRNARWSVWFYWPPLESVAPLSAILRFFRPRKAADAKLRFSLPRTTADANIDARGVVGCCRSMSFVVRCWYTTENAKSKSIRSFSRLMDKREWSLSLSLSLFLMTSRLHATGITLVVRSY
jgi:hypothetical protein